MSDSPQSVRHTPFFAELAGLGDGDVEWRAVSAGLVLLRLIDAWIDEGPAAIAAEGWATRAVAEEIDEMPDIPARAILRSALNAMLDTTGVDMLTVAPRLMAYARSLDADARYSMAADVYETVIAYCHPAEQADQVVTAHVRLSYCRRQLGQLQEAKRRTLRCRLVALRMQPVTSSARCGRALPKRKCPWRAATIRAPRRCSTPPFAMPSRRGSTAFTPTRSRSVPPWRS